MWNINVCGSITEIFSFIICQFNKAQICFLFAAGFVSVRVCAQQVWVLLFNVDCTVQQVFSANQSSLSAASRDTLHLRKNI